MTESDNPQTVANSSRSARIRQVVNDCVRRRSSGETVADQALIKAHPKLMPELGDELGKLHLIEEAKRQAHVETDVDQHALRICCPHCHNHVEVLDNTSLSDVMCSSCGSHFSLAGEEPQSFQAALDTCAESCSVHRKKSVGAASREKAAGSLHIKIRGQPASSNFARRPDLARDKASARTRLSQQW